MIDISDISGHLFLIYLRARGDDEPLVELRGTASASRSKPLRILDGEFRQVSYAVLDLSLDTYPLIAGLSQTNGYKEEDDLITQVII